MTDVVARRLGADRAASLAAELAEHELVVVDAGELARLEQQAAGYRKMAALVDGPDD